MTLCGRRAGDALKLPVDADLAARLLGAMRAMIGITALAAPLLPAAPWVGTIESDRASVRLFARTLGGRDLALGLGLLAAANRRQPLRGWVLAGALADGGDALATVVAFSELPRRSRWLILMLTAGAAAAGLVVALALDNAEP